MRYRRLDESGDMTFGSQQADFLRNTPEAVAQAVLTRLRLWLGEWFIDQSEGTPYQQAVLGKNTSKSVAPAMRARIIETEGVKSLDAFEFLFDADERKATIRATVTTLYGEVIVQGVL